MEKKKKTHPLLKWNLYIGLFALVSIIWANSRRLAHWHIFSNNGLSAYLNFGIVFKHNLIYAMEKK